MDDGGGFPTINYVPIDHGTNVLDSLMQLYGAIKQAKSQTDENNYLKQNPYQNATNVGALDAAMKIFGGKEGEARSAEYGAEGQAAASNAASHATEVGNEGAYQAGLLKNDQARVGEETTRDTNEDFRASQNAALEALKAGNQDRYDQGMLQDTQDKTAMMDKDRTQATDEKADANAMTNTFGLLDHYQKMMMASPDGKLPPQEQANYEQVRDHAMKQAGIPTAPSTNLTPGTGGTDVLPRPGSAEAASRAKQDWYNGLTDPNENAAPGSVQPDLITSKRVGGKMATPVEAHNKQALEQVYQDYASGKLLEDTYGIDPTHPEKSVDAHYPPELLKHLKERYQIEHTQPTSTNPSLSLKL